MADWNRLLGELRDRGLRVIYSNARTGEIRLKVEDVR